MSQEICFKRNIHRTMIDEFQKYLFSQTMVDVTLACDGKSLKAHKLILSSCSPFFQSLFLENPCKHPIVILKDVKYTELKAVIDFVYHGEVNVTKDRLEDFLKTAETLRIKVLVDNVSDVESVKQSSTGIESLVDDAIENQLVGVVDDAIENQRVEVFENKSGDADEVRVHQSGTIRYIIPDQPTSKRAISSPKRKKMKVSELHKEDRASEPKNEQRFYLSTKNVDISDIDMDSSSTLSALKVLLESKKQSTAVTENLANNDIESQNIEVFENNTADVPLHQSTSKANISSKNTSHNDNTISEPMFYLSAVKIEHCDTELGPLTLSASAVPSESIQEGIHDKDIAGLCEMALTQPNETNYENIIQLESPSNNVNQQKTPLKRSSTLLGSVSFETTVLRELKTIKTNHSKLMEKVDSILKFKNTQQQFQINSNHNGNLQKEWMKLIPLSNFEDLQKLEENLEDDNIRNEMIQFLSKLGGENCEKATKMMLRKIITEEVATSFSYQGIRQKRSFRSLQICQSILCAVKNHMLWRESSEFQIERTISNWLRHAKARMENKKIRTSV